MPPIIIHATMSLSNWRKLDPEGAFSLPNLTTIYSLDSTRWLIPGSSLVTKPHFRDLAVFFMVPILVEKASIPAVKAILAIQVPFFLFLFGDQARQHLSRPWLKKTLSHGPKWLFCSPQSPRPLGRCVTS